MTKTFGTNKFSNPTQILRRVLSKTSNSSRTSVATKGLKAPAEKRKGRMDGCKESRSRQTVNVEAELQILKQQIDKLQLAVGSMQNETEKKEATIANLATEKERLAADLRKQQRANTTLKQQLEEEREFYYKEKELYCKEMNNCKKLKKTLKVGDYKAQIDYYKKEIAKLKDTLTQTLEANYNLSVKFLRMKNTKYCVKNRLKKLEALYAHTVSEFTLQMDHLKSELVNVVDKQLQIPIPPSNKKYLQLVKQNSTLAHENLCLRLELDKRNLELDKHRVQQIQNETNSKLKYINHKTRSEPQMDNGSKTPRHERKESHSEYKLHAKEAPEPLNLFPLTHTEERTHEKRKKKGTHDSVPKKDRERNDIPSLAMHITTISEEPSDRRDDGEEDFDLLRLQLMEKPSQTYTQSSDCTQSSYDAVRTQSAPEIVQTSLFFNDK